MIRLKVNTKQINPDLLWYHSSLFSILHPCCLWTLQWFSWDFFYIVLSCFMILVMDFSFLSPFLFYLFLLFSCRSCVCRCPPPLHLRAGCKTAVELRWEVRGLQRHQGEQAICARVCIYVCVCVCVCVFLYWCVVLLSGLTVCSIKLPRITTLV